MLVPRSRKTTGISTRYNLSSILFQDKLPMFNLKLITRHKFPQLTIILIQRTCPKIHHNCINQSGFIWIDMCLDFTDSLRKALLKEMVRTREIEKLRYYFILKIILFQWIKRSFKIQVFLKENFWKDKSMLRKMENFWLPMILELDNL